MKGMHITSGKLLDDRDHLRQSIENILTTPIGSRVMRRDFGSKLFELIDAPLSPENLIAIYSAVIEALSTWEPRVKVRRVTAQQGSGPGHIEINIDGTYLPDGQPIRLERIVV